MSRAGLKRAREQRRARAAERLAAHVYDPRTCKPGCAKRPVAQKRTHRETGAAVLGGAFIGMDVAHGDSLRVTMAVRGG